ncbi:PEP-CTERM sorting domain-containing protein [Scytonema sp. PCC 10023]|uniref:PEP-CTERM sorting domain-containing protein n=1 Tax=Scytonema sp. PCC 10023 TaxID=1680591 RepID=UPI0039C67928
MQRLSVPLIGNILTLSLATVAMTLMSAYSATAGTLALNFTKLQGLTGGNSNMTGVYRADLSNLGFDISSIAITDSNTAIGGASGKFTGFDFDAIKISNVLVDNATDAKNLSGLNVFDFTSSGTFFTPGTQRSPADPGELFGVTGGIIDNSLATLENFDGNSTADANAFGFVSLGDGGTVVFNLKNPIPTTSPLYLYIGEAGDNGEVVNGRITVSDKPREVPEPTSLAAVSLLGIYFAVSRRKKTKAA